MSHNNQVCYKWVQKELQSEKVTPVELTMGFQQLKHFLTAAL